MELGMSFPTAKVYATFSSMAFRQSYHPIKTLASKVIKTSIDFSIAAAGRVKRPIQCISELELSAQQSW